jgi:hypothetical protein
MSEVQSVLSDFFLIASKISSYIFPAMNPAAAPPRGVIKGDNPTPTAVPNAADPTTFTEPNAGFASAAAPAAEFAKSVSSKAVIAVSALAAPCKLDPTPDAMIFPAC